MSAVVPGAALQCKREDLANGRTVGRARCVARVVETCRPVF